jgi:hypothetical protein
MTHKKFVVLFVIAGIFIISSIWTVAQWLEVTGIIGWAEHIRAEFLTGTAIAVIAVMLYLLPGPRRAETQPHYRDNWPFD